jgi:hypothetical protein
MKKLLKVLEPGLISPYQHFQFKIGKKYHCEDFDTDITHDCSNGFYAVNYDGLLYAYRVGKEIYSVEVSGKQIEINEFKRRYENIKIVNKLNIDNVAKTCKKVWDKKVKYLLSEVINPINPLLFNPKITDKDIELLKQWDSVWDSVGASVWDSVGASVGASVWDSVWYSVGASVGAYYGSFFILSRDDWKYTEKIKTDEYPFLSVVKLWEMGLVPSFDGKKWRLHGGKGAKILWEGKL